MVIEVIGSVGFIGVALIFLPHVRASVRDRVVVWQSKRRLKRGAKARANAAVWQ
jgi:hypothetical protein